MTLRAASRSCASHRTPAASTSWRPRPDGRTRADFGDIAAGNSLPPPLVATIRRVGSVVRSALVAGLVSISAVLEPFGCTRGDPAAAPPPVVAAAGSAQLPSAPAALPTVRYVGRFDTSNPSAVRFAWSGSSIIARFKGTGISARLKDEGRNSFQVIVDGEAKKVFKSYEKKEIFPLAEGLPDGVHEVALYKRTEADVGEVVFQGFEVHGGTLLPAQPGPNRRIELIGDSITAGYGNEGPGAVCTFNSDEENGYATYGALTARALGAEHVTIAWSGKTIGMMTDMYDRVLPAHPEPLWDFKAWIPHVVVMNVGTNNFAVFDPGETKYVRIYTALFDRVRKVYPDAFIVCALGPMLSDNYPEGKQNLTKAKKYMKATMAKIRASGETNFEYVEFPEQKHSDGLGCGFHPSLKTHKLMAERLTGVIKERLGW